MWDEEEIEYLNYWLEVGRSISRREKGNAMSKYFIEDYVRFMMKRSRLPLPSLLRKHPVDSLEHLQTKAILDMYYRSGQQVVRISEDMYELLLRTDLSGVRPEDLRLPYDCICFAMPHEHTINVVERRGMTTQTVYLRKRLPGEVPSEISKRLGIDNRNFVHPQETRRLMAEKGVTQDEVDESVRSGFLAYVGILDHSNGYTAMTWVGFGKGELDEAAAGIDKAAGGDLEHIIKEKVGSVDITLTHDSLGGPILRPHSTGAKGSTVRMGVEDDFFKVMKVAMNAVVYLNHGLDAKFEQRRDESAYREFTRLYCTTNSESKRRTYGRKVTKIARPTVRVLGPNIKRGTLNTQSATDVIVRGHWHTYWVGRGRSSRKLNWVQPYVRNKDKGIVPGEEPRTYEI